MQDQAAADEEMQNERLWTLIARKLACEASQNEINELEELQRENHHISYYIEMLSAWWKLAEREGKDEAEKAFNGLLEKLESDEHYRQPKKSIFRVGKEGRRTSLMKSLQQPYGKKNTSHQFLKINLMLKNYFKIAWRNVARHKSYTFINVIGLAFGICACIVIFLITDREFSLDKFHANSNRIYHIVGVTQNSSRESKFLNASISDVVAFKDQIAGPNPVKCSLTE